MYKIMKQDGKVYKFKMCDNVLSELAMDIDALCLSGKLGRSPGTLGGGCDGCPFIKVFQHNDPKMPKYTTLCVATSYHDWNKDDNDRLISKYCEILGYKLEIT